MSQSPDSNSSVVNKLFQVIKRPSTLIVTGSVIVVGIVTYATGRIWLQRNLPTWLETELNKTLNRPVEIGKISNLSLNRLTVEGVSIPETESDPDTLSIALIDIKYNLLPLLIRRPLNVQASIVDLEAYIAEDEPGKWLELELPPQPENTSTESPLEKLPIKLDIGLEIENSVIQLQPLTTQELLVIEIDGNGRYRKTEQQLIDYDFNTTIANGNLNITGNTILDNGKTQVQIKSDPLNLVPIFSLIPNNFFTIDTGEFQANLDANIAPRDNLERTRGQGTININNLRGRIDSNQETISADLDLIWSEQTIAIEQAQVNLGQLQGELTGEINWQQGYQLQLNLDSIDLAELVESFQLELPIAIAGQLNSQININGALDNPEFTGILNNITPVSIDKISLSQLNGNLSGDLQQINIDNLTLEPTVGGKVELTGQLNPVWSETPLDWRKIAVLANFRSELPLEKLIASYYQLPVEVSLDKFQSVGILQGTLGNPAGKLQWLLSNADPTIQGQGEIILQDQVINIYNTFIDINGGNVEVNAIASLDSQTWNAQIDSQDIVLTPFLPTNLPTESVRLNNAQIELAGNFSLEKVDDWSGLAQLNLDVDRGNINVDTQLNQGTLNTQLQARQINVYPEINLNQAQVNLLLPLDLLLNAQNINKETLETIQGEIQANVNINNQGELNTNTLINQGNWSTVINANQLQLSNLNPLLTQPVNAQVQLEGELEYLFQENIIIPIAVNQADIALGENSLSSQGMVQLALRNNQPEIDLVDLNLDALVNLAEIPLETILDQVNLPVVLTPSDIDLNGKANFSGNLLAEQLLSNPLENLSLIGELQVDNLNLNQRQFEPQLIGSVIINPEENISLDLRGNRDIIAASLEPCTRDDCPLPYLPTGYQLRQGQDSEAIIVSGIRQGDQLVSEVKNFPLSIFNLAPGESFGIPGIIDGIVTADLVIDLYSFATNGELKVAQPSLGYLETEALEAKFAYDSQASQAQLIDSSFRFKNTEYNLQANLDLDSGAIQGELDLNQNNIADIFQLLQWSNINDVLRLIDPPVYTSAANFQPNNLGNSLGTIAEQVNLLWLTEQKIISNNQQIRQGNYPLELDITGQYGGQILLNGTLTQPEVNFTFQGKDWQWRTKPGILTVIDQLGLVWENQEMIEIPEVTLAGNFSNGILNVEPIRLQVEDTVVNVQGTFALDQTQKSEFSVENLSLDLIKEFVNLPLPLTGLINVNGTLTGNLNAPIVLGEVTILDTALNGQDLVPELRGEFSYDPATTAEFRTTYPEIIQLEANIPSPTSETGKGIATVDLQLTREVFRLLQVITAGQLSWTDGEGMLNINASLPLDWSEPLELTSLLEALEITGNLTLDNALIDNSIIDSQLYLQGEVQFENQLVKVEDLTVTLADTEIVIVGVFPLVKAIGSNHRDANNPLTLNIQKGNVDLRELYQGEIDGNIVLTGTALNPVIGGELILANGKVSISEGQEEEQAPSDLAESLLGSPEEVESPFKISLTDFNVQLDNISLTQFSLYRFTFGGDLILNGELLQLQDLQADGLITLTRGEVTFIDTQFILSRRQTSTLEFKGDQGLFNPDLHIYMETAVSETPSEGRQSTLNEIRDDILSQRSNRIQVNISIEGRANQIIPQLARDPVIACRLRPAATPPINPDPVSEEMLAQLSTCVQLSSIADSGQRNNDLLNSPIVSLSSSPPRPKSEIIDLLAGQFLGLAETLQNSSGTELLELGVDQFIIGPAFRDSIFAVEQFFGKGGKRVGLNDLRVYPVLENVFQISNQSSVRLTYDYFSTEAQVRYEFGF